MPSLQSLPKIIHRSSRNDKGGGVTKKHDTGKTETEREHDVMDKVQDPIGPSTIPPLTSSSEAPIKPLSVQSTPNDFIRCWTHRITTPTIWFVSDVIVSPLIHVRNTVVMTMNDVVWDFIPPVHHIIQHQQYQLKRRRSKRQHLPPHHHLHHQQLQQHGEPPSVTSSTPKSSTATNNNVSSSTSTTTTSSSSPSSVTSSSSTNTCTTSTPKIRLLDSFRLEAMQARPDSFYHKSMILPFLHFLWILIQKWYNHMQSMLQGIPMVVWPFVFILTCYMPLIPLVVVPTTTLVYHYGNQYFQYYFIIPTPQRVIEMFERISSIVHHWWTRFVGRCSTATLLSSTFSSSNDTTETTCDSEYRSILRTRKRTALAVSIATNHVIRQSKQSKPMSKSI